MGQYATDVPPALGPVTGPDGRPRVYDLDFGAVVEVGIAGIVIATGLGPRLIRTHQAKSMWLADSDIEYDQSAIGVGDKIQVSGTTLADMSLLAKHFRINSIDNLRGVLASVTASRVGLWAKNGKPAGSYEPVPTEFEIGPATRIFSGFANYREPNGDMALARPGSWAMLNGYVDKAGNQRAVDLFLGSGMPPDDVPEWIQRASGKSLNGSQNP